MKIWLVMDLLAMQKLNSKMSSIADIIKIPIEGDVIEITILDSITGRHIQAISDAAEYGEVPFQIKEGLSYEYKITKGYFLQTSAIVTESKVSPFSGRIVPNVYVGTLNIDILDCTKKKCATLQLEVQSVKTTYREDYRTMLEEITEFCTDLVLQHNSPITQSLETDYNADAKTLYQRFIFIKSVIDSDEFKEAVHKVIVSPVTKWKDSESIKDIRSVKKFKGSILRQLAANSNRVELPSSFYSGSLTSVPSRIKVENKIETIDTPENRFVKHVLKQFEFFCRSIASRLDPDHRLAIESNLLAASLEQHLSHSIFGEIESPKYLPLNSPILQRKEGYREILRAWLMFDLAAKLVWQGGDDVYSGGKRDVAILYEYWIFFKLLEVVKEVFNIEPKNLESLLSETKDGLGLQLRQGIYLPIEGVFDSGTRKLKIQFSYNKTFSGEKVYPSAGSWSKSMRPDYTLSIWPYGISSEDAEEAELITHIHFDAKYKVENIFEIVGTEDDFEREKDDQKKGNFKRIDLLKMHTYKDAIRRSGGAYILYPGDKSSYTRTGFHELIPGLGAFSIRPSKSNNGIVEVRKFLNDVVNHFLNRASQREKMSLKTFEIHRESVFNSLNVRLPESQGENRDLLPDETFVLIGYYKDLDHLNWIKSSKLYNTRTGSQKGSLRLNNETTGARYLLLHTKGETKTSKLFKLKRGGPRIFSREDMLRNGYPYSKVSDFYLVYSIDEILEVEFQNMQWDIAKLENFMGGYSSGIPVSVSLTALMNVLIDN